MNTAENLSEIIAACRLPARCDASRRAGAGQAEAFSRLVDMYARRLYGYFYRLTGQADVSDELLSEVFLKLVEKIRSYRDGSFDKWLFEIATNVFRDYLRTRRRERKFLAWKKRQLLTDSPPRSSAADYPTDSLQAHLEKLDEQTRELLALRYYSQLSFKQIAQMRSQPIGTVLSKVHRGLKRLRELMAKP